MDLSTVGHWWVMPVRADRYCGRFAGTLGDAIASAVKHAADYRNRYGVWVDRSPEDVPPCERVGACVVTVGVPEDSPLPAWEGRKSTYGRGR